MIQDYIEELKILENLKNEIYSKLNPTQIERFNDHCRAKKLPLLLDVIENPCHISKVRQTLFDCQKGDEYRPPSNGRKYRNLRDFVRKTAPLRLSVYVQNIENQIKKVPEKKDGQEYSKNLLVKQYQIEVAQFIKDNIFIRRKALKNIQSSSNEDDDFGTRLGSPGKTYGTIESTETLKSAKRPTLTLETPLPVDPVRYKQQEL